MSHNRIIKQIDSAYLHFEAGVESRLFTPNLLFPFHFDPHLLSIRGDLDPTILVGA